MNIRPTGLRIVYLPSIALEYADLIKPKPTIRIAGTTLKIS